jgi:hypothetical protein
VNGVSVGCSSTGDYHITIFNSEERYSYDVDRNGNFISKSTHFTDEAAKLLGINPTTGENRW